MEYIGIDLVKNSFAAAFSKEKGYVTTNLQK